MYEVQMKAIEVGADIKINKEHLLDKERSIIVSCIDKQKGMMLLKKTGQEVPRFSILQVQFALHELPLYLEPSRSDFKTNKVTTRQHFGFSGLNKTK